MARRLLVVEDDPDLAALLRELFEARAWEVEDTPSGADALTRLARERFDIALLDVDVLDLDGLGAQRALRDFSGLPTIVMSARADGWRADALRAGATACVEKPFRAGPLLRLVDSIVTAGEARDGWPSDVSALGEEDLRRLRALSDAELDALPFGVIRLDGEGRIRAFNAYEADAVREDAARVIGKPFAGLAPCVKVKAFMGLIGKARAGEALDEVLRFVFPRHGASALVNVRLHAEPGGPLWLFVSQRRR